MSNLMDEITGTHCLWCGCTLDNAEFPGQLYCSPGHATKQREHRAKVKNRRRITCPTPDSDGFPHRGTAFRAAALQQQYAYLCGCGVYHLTSDPSRTGRRTETRRRPVGHRTIEQLASELDGERPMLRRSLGAQDSRTSVGRRRDPQSRAAFSAA
ncbi:MULTISPECIES: hypothetical protein [Mycolicibacter]|uniref:Uncharacterized protein n=2 Tax=Mycolicibacter TaxID=1073531 RepID=A0ABU5XMC1_9MYCO|nr:MULTISPECIES: hypothetical protein [unclassified Mycolicibacter]MEB3023438.1 hypothetical protein [Mycolicibacter sp. MYC098]MEB3033780.1 hypothetical protein [Mycolicibacter sp. MYC340]